VDVPILFLTYNRPELTRKVFTAIRKAQPKQLFIAADGPKPEKNGDGERCLEVRETWKKIDWDCEVKTLLRDANFGCRRAISWAITWFFDYVEEGIILEDDTLPHPSFFGYCEELLYRYRHTPDIWHIGGNNFQCDQKRGNGSYYFSTYPHVWGWASWRRVWKLYDLDIKRFPILPSNYFASQAEHNHWSLKLRTEYENKPDMWSLAWAFAIWSNHGLSIIPNQNLVSNIGINVEATHAASDSISGRLANLPVSKIGPLVHPKKVYPDREADLFTFEQIFRRIG
jgi:hypothetical protein